MLQQLRVGNLALVEELDLTLDTGLTMLTGETGAGKSLVAGALALLTGARAEREQIRAGEELAWVEGVFDLGARPETAAWLAGVGVRLGGDDVLVLRRELRREGRGRVLINGLVSSLALLEQVGGRLLAIQSQDQQRLLARPQFALDFLDARLGLEAERARLAAARDAWRECRDELARRRREEEFARQQFEMWEYQHRELDEMDLDPVEEADLAEKLAFARNARGLLEAAARGLDDLDAGEVNARLLLGRAEAALAAVADASGKVAALCELVREAEAAAAEAARGLERFLDTADLDPARVDEMEERKARYEELRRKYGRDVPGLVALHENLGERIARQREADGDIAALEAAVAAARDELAAAAAELRWKRREGAPAVAARAAELIRPLALPELELEFQVTPRAGGVDAVAVDGVPAEIGAHGADEVRLLARTNRGEGAGEVAQIASGGEKSRIFLGLSVLGRGQGEAPLMLYDEIDAGLGMDNAIPVASLLEELAGGGQVVCITHLATVAARGRHHLAARKAVVDGRTVLSVVPLGDDERLVEIARLLGGDAATAGGAADERRAYARQLLARG
ncbi:hypothetical protein KDM41_01235 [bacterium]|nr:hypothetical protein [bacterium]